MMLYHDELIEGVGLHITRISQAERLVEIATAVSQLQVVRHALLGVPDRVKRMSGIREKSGRGGFLQLSNSLRLHVLSDYSPREDVVDFVVEPSIAHRSEDRYGLTVGKDYYMAFVKYASHRRHQQNIEQLSPQELLVGGDVTSVMTDHFVRQAFVAHNFAQKHFVPVLSEIEYYPVEDLQNAG